MIVSRNLKYVYIGIPRTASKSMNSWLVEHYQGESVGYHHQWRVPDEFNDYLRFTIVRNPYERFISGHFHVSWRDLEPREDATRVQKSPPEKAPEPLAERLSVAKAWGDGTVKLDGPSVPEVSMNQWSFVRRAGVSLVLFFERLPRCLNHLPFVPEDVPPSFPHALERGIRPSGSFFDFRDHEDEQVLWEYAEDDFMRFGYQRHSSELPDDSPDALWIS
jgi:hypothetical protein